MPQTKFLVTYMRVYIGIIYATCSQTVIMSGTKTSVFAVRHSGKIDHDQIRLISARDIFYRPLRKINNCKHTNFRLNLRRK